MTKGNNFEMTTIKEISAMKVEITWIKRILFLILAIVIGNVFVSFFS